MQRLTDWLTSDLDNVQGYVDDFLVFSATPEEHESHARQLFQKFHDAGLKINPKKTVLGWLEVKFCGYPITEDGIKPPPEKFEAIKNYPEPSTVKGFKSFLSAVNFYSPAIPNFAVIAAPLKKLLQGKKPCYAPLNFSKEANDAFTNPKLALCNHATLAHPRSDAETVLVSNASDFGCGAAIMQKIGNIWRPLAFFSKSFSPAQRKYSTFYRELLGLYLAVKHFRHYFEGNPDMVMYCDHEPLVKAFYSFYFAKAKQNNHVLKRCLDETAPANVVTQEWQGVKLLWDVSRDGVPRLLASCGFRPIIFDNCHNLTHSGIRLTIKFISETYTWPTMKKDCTM